MYRVFDSLSRPYFRRQLTDFFVAHFRTRYRGGQQRRTRNRHRPRNRKEIEKYRIDFSISPTEISGNLIDHSSPLRLRIDRQTFCRLQPSPIHRRRRRSFCAAVTLSHRSEASSRKIVDSRDKLRRSAKSHQWAIEQVT